MLEIRSFINWIKQHRSTNMNRQDYSSVMHWTAIHIYLQCEFLIDLEFELHGVMQCVFVWLINRLYI